jgi:hypothetical protein
MTPSNPTRRRRLLLAAGLTAASAAALHQAAQGGPARTAAKAALYSVASLLQKNAPTPPDIKQRLFPADNPWNTPVDREPVDPLSAQIIEAVGKDTPLHEDWGVYPDGTVYGMPYSIAERTTPRVPVKFTGYPAESDPGPYPIPVNAPIEGGGDTGEGDRHLLVLEKDEGKLYELFATQRRNGKYEAASGAIFDVNSNKLRPKGWTSSDAAGLPVLPGLVRYDEVFDRKEITHAVRFTVPRSRKGFVHPARHHAGHTTEERFPPMGMRVRLRADFDVTPYPAPVQVIMKGLKKYGMILADNGGPWFITGTADPRWGNAGFVDLRKIKGRDLEVVKMGPVER